MPVPDVAEVEALFDIYDGTSGLQKGLKSLLPKNGFFLDSLLC
jgi:hypothetical protein